MKRYAGGFIYNPVTRMFLLQQRSSDAPHNPGLWTIFGGGEEPEDNDNIEATFIREIAEETGIVVNPGEAKFLCDYWVEKYETQRYVFWVKKEVRDGEIILGEGAAFGWFTPEEARELNIGPKTLLDLYVLVDLLELEKKINEP